MGDFSCLDEGFEGFKGNRCYVYDFIGVGVLGSFSEVGSVVIMYFIGINGGVWHGGS